MGINLLGIIGSPRKMGNCELMVKEIATRVPGGAQLSMVRLVDKEIRPCKACYRCLTGDCPHQDDYLGVLRAIMQADAVVVAAPAYLRGTHSSLQRFLDRGLQAYRHVDALYGKPAVAVATAGVKDGEGSALLGVETFIRQLGLSLKGRAVVCATFPGTRSFSRKEGAPRTGWPPPSFLRTNTSPKASLVPSAGGPTSNSGGRIPCIASPAGVLERFPWTAGACVSRSGPPPTPGVRKRRWHRTGSG